MQYEVLTWEVNSLTRKFKLQELERGVTYRVRVEGFIGGVWTIVVPERLTTLGRYLSTLTFL